ncbi:MAG: cytochrome c oxidase assembly protein [Rubrimonas sp.]
MSDRRNLRTVGALAGVAVFMVGMSFAAVPLYDMFCRVTGFGGTTMTAERPSDVVLDRTISVRFDASTIGIEWRFKPVQREMTVRLGETGLAFYEATNLSDRPITGTASYNVTPYSTGGYFAKIDCFCFIEQTLQPGETVQMPVSFYVDPEIVDDAEAGRVPTITLSYTFYETEASRKLADASPDRADGATQTR